MQFLFALTALAGLTTTALGNSCNRDNCFRAILQYETTSSAFCKQYLATPTAAAPTPFATCGPSRISSACSCLTTTTAPVTTTKSATASFVTSTCVRSSTSACPTAFNPCCQYICGEAQVPFALCSPDDITGPFASCSKCPVATPKP